MADKYLIDAEGHKVPTKHIDKNKLSEHRFVYSAAQRALKLSARIDKDKEYIMARADALIMKIWAANDLNKTFTNGYSLQSFDHRVKVEVSVAKTIEFDEHIEMAQEVLNEFIASKVDGADEAVQQLVNHAFTTTKGRLDTKRVLGLFSLQIKDTEWKRAMTLIQKSRGRSLSKRYCNIWIREDITQEWKRINLNWSSS